MLPKALRIRFEVLSGAFPIACRFLETFHVLLVDLELSIWEKRTTSSAGASFVDDAFQESSIVLMNCFIRVVMLDFCVIHGE